MKLTNTKRRIHFDDMDAIIAKISFLLFSTFEAQHNGAGGLYSSGIHITLILDVRRYITGNLQGRTNQRVISLRE